MAEVDFRAIAPIKRFDKYWQSESFIIPCKLLEIVNQINDTVFEVSIERLDFSKGKLIISKGITYQKSINLFKEMSLTLPFLTDCKIFKHPKFGIQFVVYGVFNTGGILNLITGELFNASEEVLNEQFNKNYNELRYWMNT